MKYRIYGTKKRAEAAICRERLNAPDMSKMSAIPHPDPRYTGWVVHGLCGGKMPYGLMKNGWRRLPD